jgi:hypothetical protein
LSDPYSSSHSINTLTLSHLRHTPQEEEALHSLSRCSTSSSVVEHLENLDPIVVMLSISRHATREAASEIL